MKRGPGSFEGGPGGGGGDGGTTGPSGGKRPRGDRFEARLLIPSKVAGSIIGKGGANIQKLRSDNNANVRVPDCPGPERVMTIHSDNPQIAINVIEQSVPLMSDEAANAAPGSMPAISGPQEIRLLIHQSIVGGIIGRAGFKIKEIREQTGANIKVNQTCAPQSSDRCVLVQGTIDTIVGALKLIFQIVESTDVKGPDQPYDPNNYDGFYSQEYGGYGSEVDVMGFNGMNGGRGMNRSGGYGGGFGGYGGGGAVGYGQDQQFQGGRGRGGSRGISGGNRGGGRPRGGDFSSGDAGSYVSGFGSFQDGGNDASGETKSTQVTIPKDLAGAIIGPGGSRIRKIRSDSKATITIDEPLRGTSQRIISISGTPRSIQTAQYLLQQSVREHSGPAGHSFVAGIGGGRY